MASTSRKSAAIALAVVGVAGLSLAAAAQLTVNNTTLQAGATTIDAECDADGVVAMDYDYTFTAGAYVLSAVNVTGIDADCITDMIGVTLIPETGSAISLTDTAVTGATATWTGAGLNGATMASIFNVAVVIHD